MPAEEFETGNTSAECEASTSESLCTGHMHTPVWMPRDTHSWELLPQHSSHTNHIINRGVECVLLMHWKKQSSRPSSSVYYFTLKGWNRISLIQNHTLFKSVAFYKTKEGPSAPGFGRDSQLAAWHSKNLCCVWISSPKLQFTFCHLGCSPLLL